MEAYQCKMCGGSLVPQADGATGVCEYCGTHFGRYQGQATVEIEPDITTICAWDGSVVYRIVNDYNVNVKVVSE